MLRQYEHSTRSRRNSFIKENDNVFNALSIKPSAGNTADTRFFSSPSIEKKLVVKRPKYNLSNLNDRKEIDLIYENAYKREQTIWNKVYPENPAQLISEGGLRLILPYIKGENLSKCISSDSMIRCKQLLSVAYAILAFHQSGWNYSDFNTDNVLIDAKSDGNFQAYLIDFDAIFDINQFRTNHELFILNGLLSGIPGLNGGYFSTLDAYIHALCTQIETFPHFPEASDRNPGKTALL